VSEASVFFELGRDRGQTMAGRYSREALDQLLCVYVHGVGIVLGPADLLVVHA
jgi:hypothetical protein